jgi:hypothetical protein
VHCASWIEVNAARFRGDDDAPVHRFRHVITQGLGYRIEGQRPGDEPLDEFQAAHLLLLVGANGAICLAVYIHHEIIVHWSKLVSRFSDIIISGGNNG